MSQRKALSFSLALVLCVCITAPCFSGGGQSGSSSGARTGPSANLNLTGLPLVKDRETYSIAISMRTLSQNSMPDKEAVIRAERDTNIRVNWVEIIETAWIERLNILFASGDLPDAIVRPPANLVMQNLPLLVDLTNMLDTYTPVLSNFLKTRPDIKSNITAPDGRIYSFPSGVEQPWGLVDDSLFIDKEWLDALRLPVPSTTEEFYSMLRAFKENDMNGNGNRNDEIPFSFCQANTQFNLKSMFGSFGVLDNAEHLQIIDNVVTFTPTRPEFRDALRYFNRLYSEGLMDPEGLSQSIEQYTAKGRLTPTIYGSFIANVLGNIVGLDQLDKYIPVSPLKGPGGHQLWNRSRAAGLFYTGFVITNKCRSPEALIRWYDYVNSSFDTVMLWHLGPVNMAWAFDEKGLWRNIMTNVPSGGVFEEYWFTVAVGGNGPQLLQIYDTNAPTIRSLEGDWNTLYKLASQAKQEPYFPKAILPQGLEEPGIIQERSILFADIDNYVRNFIATSIMNGITDAQWNEHIRNSQRLNIPRYVQSYQGLYDRSK